MIQVFALGVRIEDEYPEIAWAQCPQAADRFLAFDALLRAEHSAPESALKAISLSTDGARWGDVDVIRLSPGIAVSDRARRVFLGMDVTGLRFSPFSLDGAPAYVMSSNRIVDCVDYTRAEVERFRGSPNRVKRIVSYAFNLDLIAEPDVFKLPELHDGMFAYSAPLFVTGSVVEAIQTQRLVGFRFERLA